MKWIHRFLVLVVGLTLLAPAAFGSMELNAVEIPSNSVTVHFTPTEGGPAFPLKAELNYRHGQTRVEVHFAGVHNLPWKGKPQPAVLYGGDVTCYVLWAIKPDGEAENLGELRVTGDNLSHNFRTPSKEFALIVTAESYSLVQRPSELVVFYNEPPSKKDVMSKSISFGDFARAPAHTESSITDLEYDKTEPMNLVQARKAYELAGRSGAKEYAPDLYARAGTELETAEDVQHKKLHRERLNDASRGSIDASAQAIHIATSTMAAELLAEVIAARQARIDALEVRSETDELVIAVLRERQAHLEETVGILSGVVVDALATIVETRRDGASIVLILPDVLFKTDQADLAPQAEIALAKLGGIMLVFPRISAAVAGYTDSTGTEEHNLDLSLRRAEAVSGFLANQGLDPGRMTSAGFGAEDPIADNSTPDGRKQNRRVEITVVASISGL